MDTTTAREEAVSTALVRVELYLENWNRQDWMQEHGEWASAQWDDERADYAEALKEALEASGVIADALEEAPDDDDCDSPLDLDEAIDAARELVEKLEKLAAASKAMDGAVRADESDYIAEGVIDQEELRGRCDDTNRVGHESWQAWDCREGWSAHLLDDGRVVLNWWRSVHGTTRHARDLWVLVDTIDMPDSVGDE